jgi:hypothetical protein
MWLWIHNLLHVQADPTLAAGNWVAADTGIARPDFRGDWKIDLAASESLAPILRAKGKSALESLMVSKAPITHVIRGDERRMTITVRTPVFEQTEQLLLDGTPTEVKDPEGKPVMAVTRWSDDGLALITVTRGDAETLTFTRSLDPDRRTMYLDMEYRPANGMPIAVRRVFRLVRLADG